jgi:hypothetical protein
MCWDLLISFMLSLVLTTLTCFSRCCSGLMICSTHLDEFATCVKSYTVVMSLCTFSGQLDSLIDRLDNRRMTHGSQSVIIDC